MPIAHEPSLLPCSLGFRLVLHFAYYQAKSNKCTSLCPFWTAARSSSVWSCWFQLSAGFTQITRGGGFFLLHGLTLCWDWELIMRFVSVYVWVRCFVCVCVYSTVCLWLLFGGGNSVCRVSGIHLTWASLPAWKAPASDWHSAHTHTHTNLTWGGEWRVVKGWKMTANTEMHSTLCMRLHTGAQKIHAHTKFTKHPFCKRKREIKNTTLKICKCT